MLKGMGDFKIKTTDFWRQQA